MSKILDDTIFSDFALGLTQHPITGKLVPIKNLRAVAQSVKNCVLTNFGERYKMPKFGSDVKASLFENHDPITLAVMRRDIVDSIRNHEPRVDTLEVVLKDDLNRNAIYVSITFTVKNRMEPETVGFFLERIR